MEIKRLVTLISFLVVFPWSLECEAGFSFSKESVEHISVKYGLDAIKRIGLYEKLINTLKTKNDFEKLLAVNDFVNQMQWVSDQYAWGVEDHWASPLESLGRNMGDCEDYVISKYFALRRAGISDDKLYFTYVKAIGYDKVHMILVYYPSAKAIPLVLDNINKKILPGTHRSELIPVYSFNAKSLFLARQAGQGALIPGKDKQNKKWVDFLVNLEKESL
ncbi:MAG: transglutaminase-like cysteine peptidase [Campylobacterota bacterium]|nr:transglutaminase-like cysteine peptidase [Campylobacterota bacterium]